jgi:glycosyltransferase involved in cell wall biosynthesis
MPARLWLDVEDLFEYASGNSRPSGIQRLAFELYRALQAQYGDTGLVRFVRHDPAGNGFRSVPWAAVAGLFAGLAADERRPGRTSPSRAMPGPARRSVRRLGLRLPLPLRVPLADAVRAQAAAFRAWRLFLGALGQHVPRVAGRLGRRAGRAISPGRDDFAALAAAGDILLVLGAAWSRSDYAALLEAQRQRYGLRFGMLVYDLIPARRPEWVGRGLSEMFQSWIDSVLPLCDFVFTISCATATDLKHYVRERGIVLAGPVVPLPTGTGFGGPAPREPAPRTPRLPLPGTYALFVSTIEARKNHILLFRVWRRLLEEMPRESIPRLVFAGRRGGLTEDLMQQIASTDYLDGWLKVIERPTDTELVALYQGCLFTLFPSLFEGWGLPVTESLAFGKPCLIADRTSLPEAGGDLVRRFDPENLQDAYAAIREVIEDRPGLARWEARVRREFRPVPWTVTVEALLVGLGDPLTTGRERTSWGRSAASPTGADAIPHHALDI